MPKSVLIFVENIISQGSSDRASSVYMNSETFLPHKEKKKSTLPGLVAVFTDIKHF